LKWHRHLEVPMAKIGRGRMTVRYDISSFLVKRKGTGYTKMNEVIKVEVHNESTRI
jgi:hypothetical protein